jgi:hypothetical protein
MAKVKIQGHASGTGILTVTAPNTSTDRTITLPDETATLSTFDPDGAVVINDTGADVDFRVEGSGAANALFVQGSDGNVGIGVANPKATLDIDAASKNAVGDLDDPNDYAIVIRNGSTTGTGNGIAFTNDSADNVGGAILHIDRGSNNLGDLVFYTNANNSGDPSERMRITNDGRGLSQFTAKVWCRYNGNGTPAFYDSHNCDSLTDNGTGDYTVNFTVSMANTDYAHFVNNSDNNTNATLAIAHSTGTFDEDGMQVLHQDVGGDSGGASGNIDSDDCSVLVFGD